MENELWADEEMRAVERELENRQIESELEEKGYTFSKLEEMDADAENEFLKQMQEFEDWQNSPQITIRSLFPPNATFPSAEELSEEELKYKIAYIRKTLSEHNIEFGFARDLPDNILYTHLIDECFEDCVGTSGAGFTWFLDGCTGGCEECFQQKYCKTGQNNSDTIPEEN